MIDLNNKEFEQWNKNFKQVVKPKKKERIQTKFDLNFKFKRNLNTHKIGYQLSNKIKKQFKKIGEKIE